VIVIVVDKGDIFLVFVVVNGNKLFMIDVVDFFFDINFKGSFGYEYVNLGGGINVNFVIEFL